jgi:hypothetical protein
MADIDPVAPPDALVDAVALSEYWPKSGPGEFGPPDNAQEVGLVIVEPGPTPVGSTEQEVNVDPKLSVPEARTQVSKASCECLIVSNLVSPNQRKVME